ncbi:hypothetical protein DYD21_14980 [Rhodohalobacter sp. SW132]|uniref:hypothetical protein n=1 Tax=Rhodohalobacter sp. SW132 TaxID=2293433 RepID=UPI000E26E70D|nr:hypothetical protein [Rhodohalobacter sp. SW132]REL29156.1 hypothetical protein DYD21_14980 [Rhodohalobacter sp. SW132]
MSYKNLSEESFKEIEKEIKSDESVVGIDAKKTHIIIIHMLQEIEKKLSELESRLKEVER